jgi:hypothetical protein
MTPERGSPTTPQVFRRATDAVWRATPGFLALARPDGATLDVSGPGFRIWQLLVTPATMTELVIVLATEYGAPLDEVERDVDEFIKTLADSGFVHADP